MNQSIDGLSAAPSQIFRPKPVVSFEIVRKRFLVGFFVLFVGIGAIGVALAADARWVSSIKSLLPPGHYLVLLQNNAELRPSGGFIGSFATVDIGTYGYSNLRIDTNIYKRDNAFAAAHIITPPKPLEGVAANNAWTMRDSNWDIDFRDAAQRVSWFYEQEGGEPVDGVIAINATVLQDFLSLTGPIPLGDGSTDQLSADNFFDLLHYKIEKEYFYDPTNRTKNEPKTILKQLVPTIERSIVRPGVLAKLGSLILQELDERQIQIFHTDSLVEDRIIKSGWGGTLSDTNGDFLLINNASVGGQKSSLNIAQSVSVNITSEGSQTLHRLVIERTHTGDGVWPDHTNNNYTRITVPGSAELLRLTRNSVDVLSDVQIDSERGKTIIGIHFDTSAGTTSHLEVDYRTSGTSKQLLYQKQSGILSERLNLQVKSKSLFGGLITTDKLIELP